MTLKLTDNFSSFSFRNATNDDSATITCLINSAYRGDSSRAGWTTEADLIEGARTTQKEITDLIALAGSMILLCIQQDKIVGSVLIQKNGAVGYLGLFVVNPLLQGTGIGKLFMREAEKKAKTDWGITKMTMSVITIRKELIAFYERRGYRRTGDIIPFPTDTGESIPQCKNLLLETMEKNLL